MSVIERLTELVNDIKVAAGVGVGTASGGIGQWLELLPDNWLTKTATLVGMVLSMVLIYTHLARHLREERMAKVDLQIKLKALESEEPPE
ncbi:coil containing protein [Vibrio phage 1.009.O._10N.261.51.C9]|nr:coil containing protein [Vibrio phage 1.009.O._10N.261.51.C9]